MWCNKLLIILVGAERFELPTLCSQSRCATRLRYAPTHFDCIAELLHFVRLGWGLLGVVGLWKAWVGRNADL